MALGVTISSPKLDELRRLEADRERRRKAALRQRAYRERHRAQREREREERKLARIRQQEEIQLAKRVREEIKEAERRKAEAEKAERRLAAREAAAKKAAARKAERRAAYQERRAEENYVRRGPEQIWYDEIFAQIPIHHRDEFERQVFWQAPTIARILDLDHQRRKIKAELVEKQRVIETVGDEAPRYLRDTVAALRRENKLFRQLIAELYVPEARKRGEFGFVAQLARDLRQRNLRDESPDGSYVELAEAEIVIEEED